MLRNQIITDLKIALEKLGITGVEPSLEHPAEMDHGDYSTNVAMTTFGLKGHSRGSGPHLRGEKSAGGRTGVSAVSGGKHLGGERTPLELAQKIVANFPPSDYLEKIEVVLPGFINLWLKTDYLISQLAELLEKKDAFGKTDLYKDQKRAVEYTDPNPFKEFHLGHLYSNFIGESITLLFEANGAKVWRGDFYGDVGMHVAKSVWGMMEKMKKEGITLADLEKLSVNQRQAFLGKGYALGVVKYDEDEKITQEIKDINLLIYICGQEILKKEKNWQPIINYRQYLKGNESRLKEITPIYEAGLRWSLDYFESIYRRLGTKFDGYYPESWVGEYGMKIVQKGLDLGVLEKSDKTVIYRGEQDGLHTRVFVNKLGLPTYEAKDLGLALAKYQDFKYDFSLNVFGKEIDEYYKVVRAALIKIEPELGQKAHHLAHGMVKLPQGKMSSRSGNVITFEWLIDEAKKYSLKIMAKVDMTQKEKERVAEIVGLGAIRYALLKSNIGGDVIFDFTKSITFDGDSGPYLQYTYARTRSVLAKAKNSVIPSTFTALSVNEVEGSHKPEVAKKDSSTRPSALVGMTKYAPEELSLLRTLYRFPEVVQEAAKTYSPNLVCSFLFDLAQKYNLFYNRHSILNPEVSTSKVKSASGDADSPLSADSTFEVKRFRLALTAAVGQVIKNGLYLLGIKTVEKM